MTKVKIFGVLRSTIGFGYLEVEAKTVAGVFEEISRIMEKGYYADLKKQEEDKNNPEIKHVKARNAALNPQKKLGFSDAIVYVNGDRCMKKGKKIADGDEIWLLSPAAGG